MYVIIICDFLLTRKYRLKWEGWVLKQLTGKETPEITVPLNKDDYSFHTDNNWQVVLICYSGYINNHYPKDSLLGYF